MNANATQKINALTSAIDSIFREILALFADVASRHDSLKAEQILTQSDKSRAEATEELVAQVSKYIQNKINDLNNSLTEHQQEINQLEKDKNLLQIQNEELTAELTDLNNQVRKCEDSKENLLKKHRELREVLARANIDITSLTKKNREYATKVKHLEITITKLESTEKLQIKQLKSLSQKRDKLESQMSIATKTTLIELRTEAKRIADSYSKYNKNKRTLNVWNKRFEELRVTIKLFQSLEIDENNKSLAIETQTEIENTHKYLKEKKQELPPLTSVEESILDSDESDDSSSSIDNIVGCKTDDHLELEHKHTSTVKANEPELPKLESSAISQTLHGNTLNSNNKVNGEQSEPKTERTSNSQQSTIEVKDRIMADYDKIMRRITHAIPVFTGEGPSVRNDLLQFLDCCEGIFASLGGGAEEINIFWTQLKFRFKGDAYDLINRSDVKDLKQLGELLKNTYLPKQNLGGITAEMMRAKQRQNESITEYARRLNALLNDCKNLIRKTYDKENEALITEKEMDAIRTFKRGIANERVRTFIRMSDKTGFTDLIKLATKFEEEEQYNNSQECDENNINRRNHQSCNVASGNGNTNEQRYNNRSYNQYDKPDTERYNGDRGYNYNYDNRNNFRNNGNGYLNNRNNNAQGGYNNYRNQNRNNFGPNNHRQDYDNNQRNNNHNNYSNYVCNYCGESGHQKHNCPVLQDKKYCLHCKQEGHLAINCERNPQQINAYCDNCGAFGHAPANCTINNRASSSATSPPSGNENVQVKDAKTSAR